MIRDKHQKQHRQCNLRMRNIKLKHPTNLTVRFCQRDTPDRTQYHHNADEKKNL